MFLDHGRSSAAQGLSGSNEIQRLQLKDLTADNPGHAHPVKTAVNDEDGNQAGTDFLQYMKHGHRIDEVLQGFADDHFDDNNEKDLRHRIDDIHHTHHDDIDFAADESGDGSVNASHDHNDHGGYQTDDHGNPGTDTATNPYGWTKWMLEQVLTDIHTADPEWNVILLRYFNPIGAHKSGLIGEDPKGIPNNLLPYVAQVAIGKLQCINVFGDDYDTPDGTGVRDYIHVVDLARGHVKAIQKLADKDGVNIYNLGTGKGYSVLDVIHAFEKACGKKLPYVIKPRRAGDIATCYSKCDKAAAELGWTAQYDIDEMCADSWNWQTKNPNGYND